MKLLKKISQDTKESGITYVNIFKNFLKSQDYKNILSFFLLTLGD